MNNAEMGHCLVHAVRPIQPIVLRLHGSSGFRLDLYIRIVVASLWAPSFHQILLALLIGMY